MPQTIRVATPDHIEFVYQLAGIGSRFAAAAVDHLIQFGLYLLVVFVVEVAALSWFVEVSAAVIVLIFVVVFGYFLLFEWLWGGQTPGKKTMGLRVMYDDGRPLDFSASAIRNILRLADFLPIAYGLGVTAMFISPKLQRIGDIACGTIVVIERPIRQSVLQATRPTAEPQSVGFGLDRADREAAIRFLERRSELDHSLRREIAVKLASRIAERAHFDQQGAVADPEAFLERIARSE